MFSYEERIETFKDWPQRYNTFTKKLAVLGQYSQDPATQSSKCAFCRYTHNGWDISQRPLFEHLKDNPGCPIFKLQYLAARKEVSDSSRMYAEKEGYLNRRFIQLNTFKNKDQFFCVRCGSIELEHACARGTRKITEDTDLESGQFYMKYFGGCFIDGIEAYMKISKSKNLESGITGMNQEQRKMLEYLLKINLIRDYTMTLEKFLEECSEKIFHDLDRKMRKIEDTAIENIYNESMIL